MKKLRLTTTPSPRLRRRRPRPAPVPFPVAGVMLLVISIVLIASSWQLFERGQPGAPIFPDLRGDYGVDSTVTVYLPSTLTWSAMDAIYEQHDSAHVEQQLNLTTEPGGPLPAVVELRGAARVDRPTVGGLPADTVELGDRQLILVDIGAGSRGGGRVRGTMRVSPLASENSRTAFASPTVGVQKFCADLDSVTADGRWADLTYARWSSLADACPLTAYPRQTFIRLVTGSTPVRVDYLETQPMEAGGSPMFRWKNEGVEATLRVRSSFVDINGEALAQRLFFLAGVAVGLATACAPYAVQAVTVYAGTRRRRPGGA